VAAAFARIGRDPRHGAVDLRLRTRALCRFLPDQPMALRTRACLDPGLVEIFGVAPGFPVEVLPADVLAEFMVRACRSAGRRREADIRVGPRRVPLDKSRQAF
jgi:hypothetical protein